MTLRPSTKVRAATFFRIETSAIGGFKSFFVPCLVTSSADLGISYEFRHLRESSFPYGCLGLGTFTGGTRFSLLTTELLEGRTTCPRCFF